MNPPHRGLGLRLGLALTLGLGAVAEAQTPPLVSPILPVYPQIAQSARVAGVVEVAGTIDRDGRVFDVRVNRSAPLLDQAVIDAVRRWRFAYPPGTATFIATVRFGLNDPFRYPRPAAYDQPLPSWMPRNFALVYEYECSRAKVAIDSISRSVTHTRGRPPTSRLFMFNFDRNQASDVFVTLVGAGFFDPSIAALASRQSGYSTWQEDAPLESGIRQTGERIFVTVGAEAPVVEVSNQRQIQWIGGDQPVRRYMHTLRARREDRWTEFRWIEPPGANRPDYENALANAGRQIRALVKKNLSSQRVGRCW